MNQDPDPYIEPGRYMQDVFSLFVFVCSCCMPLLHGHIISSYQNPNFDHFLGCVFDTVSLGKARHSRILKCRRRPSGCPIHEKRQRATRGKERGESATVWVLPIISTRSMKFY